MFNKILALFEHKHRWRTRRVNKWGVATVQLCDCGELRQIIKKPDSKDIGSNFFWLYNDGTTEPDERVFKHV